MKTVKTFCVSLQTFTWKCHDWNKKAQYYNWTSRHSKLLLIYINEVFPIEFAWYPMSQRRVLFEMKNSCEEKYKSIIVLPTLTLELFWGNMCYSWARKISLKNFFSYRNPPRSLLREGGGLGMIIKERMTMVTILMMMTMMVMMMTIIVMVTMMVMIYIQWWSLSVCQVCFLIFLLDKIILGGVKFICFGSFSFFNFFLFWFF